MGSESVWGCINTKSVGKLIILGHALYCIKTPMPGGVWIVSEGVWMGSECVWMGSACVWGCIDTKYVGKNV